MSRSGTQQGKRHVPTYTWFGLLIMVGAQIGLYYDIVWVTTWLTPLMWSGYILFLDGLLYVRQGRSWLTTRRLEFPLLALLSIGIWLLFEAYNFHLQNWLYGGVPETPWVRNLAYAWSFATIIPGVFITAETLLSFFPAGSPPSRLPLLGRSPDWVWILVGAVLITIPLALPIPEARFLFGAVWLGFIFLMDPINHRLGAPSLKHEWRQGKYRLTLALLLSGFVCGLLWEAWNFQAFIHGGGHWIYTVPEPLRLFGLHYGQMPALGMLGFPPFALELYLMYHFARAILDSDRILGPLDW